MRTLSAVLGVVVLMVAVSGCGSSRGGETTSKPDNPYIGTWKGKDLFGQTMEITLAADGQLTLNVSGKRRGYTRKGSYSIDSSSSPAKFNIKLRDRKEIKTVCKLIGKNKLIFENTNSSDRRPTGFGRRKIELTRQ